MQIEEASRLIQEKAGVAPPNPTSLHQYHHGDVSVNFVNGILLSIKGTGDAIGNTGYADSALAHANHVNDQSDELDEYTTGDAGHTWSASSKPADGHVEHAGA